MTVLEPPIAPAVPIENTLYTSADLEELPHDARYELIRGELCLMPNNSAEHGYITAHLSIHVGYFIVTNDLGACFAAETRFVIEENPDTTIGPDFAFISKERLTGIPPRGYLRIAPDLIVETRSPGDTRREFAYKVARWLNAGTQVVWAVHPANNTLVIHRTGEMPQTLTIQDTLTEEKLLPEFALPLHRIFRPA